MRVIKPGHLYALDQLDSDVAQQLQFVQRLPFHAPKPGVTNQEVLRALIDRVKVLNTEVPWQGNEQIIYHLRMALALHENRAVLRHIEKQQLPVEHYPTGPDGHWVIEAWEDRRK